MEKAEYVDRVVIRAKVCTGCTMLVDGVCCDADPCENLIAGFLEEPPADVVPAHRKENAHSAPLTLVELRQMDGEPVWVEFQDDSGGCWGLVHSAVFTHIVFANGLFCTVGKPYFGKTWLAYRQKPEEGTV